MKRTLIVTLTAMAFTLLTVGSSNALPSNGAWEKQGPFRSMAACNNALSAAKANAGGGRHIEFRDCAPGGWDYYYMARYRPV